jgi:hypothetical protein
MTEKEASQGELDLAEQTHAQFKHLEKLHGKVSADDILSQIDKLQGEVIKMKKEGISVWNANKAIPKIFDVVDGAFEIMIELTKNQKEEEEKK